MLNRAGACNCIPKISKQGKDRTERESYIEKKTELVRVHRDQVQGGAVCGGMEVGGE
jgi:hypothetical protein